MPESFIALAAATLAFVGGHFLLSSFAVRPKLVAILGEKIFTVVYSLISLATFVWMVNAYQATPTVAIWASTGALRLALLVLMPVASVFVVMGVTTPNPTAAFADKLAQQPEPMPGILRVTRHPFMWGVALWALLHILANGDLAGVILFGGLLVLALFGTRAIDAKKKVRLGADWDRIAAVTSNIPFVAIREGRNHFAFRQSDWIRFGISLVVFVALLVLHPLVIGKSPLP